MNYEGINDDLTPQSVSKVYTSVSNPSKSYITALMFLALASVSNLTTY